MQQAAINIRQENIQLFPELFNVKSKEENQNINSNASILYYNFDAQNMTSFNDWEFFCNELEYE